MTDLQNRIVELREMDTADLQDNDGNWRVHPSAQRAALTTMLHEVGIADALVAYQSERQGGLTLIDGHLRASDHPGKWPILVLDVDDAEEATVLDVDPYGDPWPTIRAFFDSDRPRADRVFVVVNDGLRIGVRAGKAWYTLTLRPAVEKFGNNLHPIYLEVCRWMMERTAGDAGYGVSAFAGYYCGCSKMATHYLAVLERDEQSRAAPPC